MPSTFYNQYQKFNIFIFCN